MKKKILALALLCSTLCLTGCNVVKEEIDYSADSKFVVVESADFWYIVYDTDTKVMYEVSKGSYNQGTFTLLVNADGTPKLWEEPKIDKRIIHPTMK